MKGLNTWWSNYKKSKAMTKAVEKLYEAQEIDHRRLRAKHLYWPRQRKLPFNILITDCYI